MENLNNQNLVQKKIAFAQSGHVEAAVGLLKDVRTHLQSIVADTQHKTLINALTLEIEAQLISRFVSEVGAIKRGEKIYNEGK